MSAITFDINDNSHSLYFGMDAYQIFAENSIKAFNDSKKGIDTSNVEQFAVIVYAGLVNDAILERSNKPSFKEAYLLTQSILIGDEKIQNDIWDAWTSSIANEQLQKLLNTTNKKKVEKKKS